MCVPCLVPNIVIYIVIPQVIFMALLHLKFPSEYVSLASFWYFDYCSCLTYHLSYLQICCCCFCLEYYIYSTTYECYRQKILSFQAKNSPSLPSCQGFFFHHLVLCFLVHFSIFYLFSLIFYLLFFSSVPITELVIVRMF